MISKITAKVKYLKKLFTFFRLHLKFKFYLFKPTCGKIKKYFFVKASKMHYEFLVRSRYTNNDYKKVYLYFA